MELVLNCFKVVYYYIERLVKKIKQNMTFLREKWVDMGGVAGGVLWFAGIGVQIFFLKAIFG